MDFGNQLAFEPGVEIYLVVLLLDNKALLWQWQSAQKTQTRVVVFHLHGKMQGIEAVEKLAHEGAVSQGIGAVAIIRYPYI